MIGGNIKAILQLSTVTEDEFGIESQSWSDVFSLTGFLDLLNGDSNTSKLLAKVEDSTHIFICDYVSLSKDGVEAATENSRFIINSKIYEVKLLDNPMEMNRQWEIYLKYLGGQ